MKISKQAEHPGIITEISEGALKVNIIEQTSCSSCPARGGCCVSERKDKTVEILSFKGRYSVDDKVTVINEPSIGLKAAFFSYVLPFITVFLTLIISIYLTKSELISGLLSIFVLIPYYFLISLFKDKLNKTFAFKLKE